jgi:hypothetical protein
MEAFINEWGDEGKKKHPNYYKFFSETLQRMQQHPNARYFIYKSIIINNLFGVDILEEAVEICKLRLFLKLVAQVEPGQKIEALPDIDFNIRAGNTLVGFVTYDEVHKVVTSKFDFDNAMKKIEVKAADLQQYYDAFRQKQLEGSGSVPVEDKKEVNKRLDALKEELNRYLAYEYGKHTEKKAEYEKWHSSHKPFHWFIEFYGIMKQGGFDVIIGNPPYISTSKTNYSLQRFGLSAGDVYAYVMIRCLFLLHKHGKFSLIVMHSLAFSRYFASVRERLRQEKAHLWFSFFGRIPAGLFSGDVRVRNCVFLLHRQQDSKEEAKTYTTRIHRWNAEERPVLFSLLLYARFTFKDVVPMFNDNTEARFFEDLEGDLVAGKLVKHSKHRLYFKQNAYNWICISPICPPSYDQDGKAIPQTKVSNFGVLNEEIQKLLLLLFGGKLFFAYWLVYGDEFDVTQDLFSSFQFPFSKLSPTDRKLLIRISREFESKLPETVQFKLNAGKKVGTYNTAKLWHLTDESDRIFLKYLTKEPEIVFESIERHVSETIKTDSDETIET